MPEVGPCFLCLHERRQQFVRAERATGMMCEGEQAVAEDDLSLQFAFNEGKGLHPFRSRVTRVHQPADGEIIVDRTANRLSICRARLGQPPGRSRT